MFGYKADTKFGRILWYVFASSVCVIALFMAILLISNFRDEIAWRKVEKLQNSPEYLHDYNNLFLSTDVVYHEAYNEYGYIYNKRLGRKTLTGVAWVCKSEDADNLAVFSNGKKRGYFDRYTGELTIPPQYEKAWIFSEGLACVMLDGKLGFIDHDGNIVIDNVFEWTPYIGNYCFHNGLCTVKGDNSGLGLIDERGNWVVEPAYGFIERLSNGSWKMVDSTGRQGLLGKNGQVVLPCEYAYVGEYQGGNYIRARTFEHVDQVFDFGGNMVNPCDFICIVEIDYAINGKSGKESASPNCLKYQSSDGHYGLMDRKGNIITPPLYQSIEAITPDRYYCEGPAGAVVLDDRGKESGAKLY